MECERAMTLSMQGMGASYSAASLEGAAAAASPLPYLCGLASSDISTLGVNDLYPSAFHAAAAAATTTADAHLFTSLNYQSSAGASQPFFHLSLGSEGNQTSFEFNIPCEEEAELAWLSQFVEDSFSDAPYQYHVTPAIDQNQPQLRADECNTGRAIRSKRSRNCIPSPVWSTLPLPQQQTSPSSSSSSSDLPHSHARRKVGGDVGSTRRGKKGRSEAGARRCTHCASDKTPQWRTGPLGPKTLCNACGVRYKSGRLVPEYRPAASPTFVVAQHSNSHRKVMELRRHKEALQTGGCLMPLPGHSSSSWMTNRRSVDPMVGTMSIGRASKKTSKYMFAAK